MFAMLLLPLLGLFGMALDLSMIYNRKAELQNAADSAALAAARELDGTAAGLSRAVTRAQDAAATFTYRYNNESVTLPASAITFSSSAGADAIWLSQGEAGNGAGLSFVKIQTDPSLGQVQTAFMGGLVAGLGMSTTIAAASAGRLTTKVTPLAICALDPTPSASRVNVANPAGSTSYNELVEYGFRRGVGYNLLDLSGSGATPQNFLVDPVYAPGTVGVTDAAGAAPFVCSGTTLATRAIGAQVKVQSPFPIANLYNQLNSRFDSYGATNCSNHTAPPDFNIKSYSPFYAGYWMANPNQAMATGYEIGGARKTVADIPPAQQLTIVGLTISVADYGPLWSYAVPVQYAATEPAGGYVAIPRTAASWSTLYPRVSGGLRSTGPAPNASYPSTTPYMTASGNNFSAPAAAHPGVRQRRVLNIPLLSCPVVGGVATVLAVGKFFMTSPATSTAVYAEFGGLAKEQEVGGTAELRQ